jgi:hypothetical protein
LAYLGGFFSGEGCFGLSGLQIDVLRAFAEELPDGKLTCTAFAHAREGRPEWPTRNTLALAFGTWEQALAAAGLASRASAWRSARA